MAIGKEPEQFPVVTALMPEEHKNIVKQAVYKEPERSRQNPMNGEKD